MRNHPDPLTLVSFDLCPYVQRAAIVLAEKRVAFERVDVNLADKPAWFTAISPLGKVPLLKIGGTVLFESGPIVEYLDEVYGTPLHPKDPLDRARHRGWMELGSSLLADIWTLETTADAKAFRGAEASIRQKLGRVDAASGAASTSPARSSRSSMRSGRRCSATSTRSNGSPDSIWRRDSQNSPDGGTAWRAGHRHRELSSPTIRRASKRSCAASTRTSRA